MLRSELKKSVNFYLIIILIIIGCMISFSSMYDELKGYINITSGSDSAILTATAINFLNNLSKEHLNSYMAWKYGISSFGIFGVMLATLAYAFTYIIDKKSGTLKNILLRVNRKKYYLTKASVNFIIGGLVASVPSIITLIVGLIFFNNTLPSITGDLHIDFPKGFLSEYFHTNPILYIGFFTLLLFCIGGIYATFALAIGCITKKVIPAILIPIIYWYVVSVTCNISGLYSIAPWNIFYFINIPNTSFLIALISTLILFGISLFIIYKESKKEFL